MIFPLVQLKNSGGGNCKGNCIIFIVVVAVLVVNSNSIYLIFWNTKKEDKVEEDRIVLNIFIV